MKPKMVEMKKWIPALSLLICCMIWGTTFVAVKEVSSKINPFLLSTLRNCIAVVILLPIILLSKHRVALMNKEAMKNGAILGIILASIYIVQTIGLKYTSSTHSAFITCSAVLMVPLMLVFSGKQRLTNKQIMSIIVVAVGLYLLTSTNINDPFNVGDIITFIGAIICAIQIIAAGYYVRKTEFIGLIFYQFLFSGIISVIGLLIYKIVSKEEIQFEASSYFGVAYLGVLGTLFCFFITVWAQKYISTIYTAMIFALEPVFASISSYAYYGEIFTALEVIGAIGIITGLIIYNIPTKKVVVK